MMGLWMEMRIEVEIHVALACSVLLHVTEVLYIRVSKRILV